MIDIEDVMLQRIDQLEEDDPDLDADRQLVVEDNRGVIAIGAEFVGSDLSWRRADALEDYNEAADDGLHVAVIVPDDAFFAMMDLVSKQGRKGITVYSYGSLGILSAPMAG